ncbi:MAG: Fe-S protein assembly co-chaperone HscB [Vicinamibacterales bacterium]|nr:Fe-S protein assembly co-chaperone HscB [Vicinamibacterales bacterium]
MTTPPASFPSLVECRNCGAGAPLREHFCPQCERILTISRHGDYFIFFGLPRTLVIDPALLEARFRDLSRKFHPDFYYNAEPSERLASLERSSYLNDAYRVLKSKVSRVEYVLGLEGLALGKTSGPEGGAKVPPSLLEEVFALNEELDGIREEREAGGDRAALRARLASARVPIERKQDEHEREMDTLSVAWDARRERPALEALRTLVLERHYLRNLLDTIDRETALLGA